MALSDGEKLIVAMLADIAIASKAKLDLDYEFIRDHADSSLWAIKRKYSGIFGGDPEDSPEDITWVHNMLTMWAAIEGIYANLPDGEKERVKAAEGSFGVAPEFKGFDGHTSYPWIAQTMIQKLDLYRVFHGRDIDSHTPDTDMHERMQREFKRRWSGKHTLDADDLIAIINERIHPENR